MTIITVAHLSRAQTTSISPIDDSRRLGALRDGYDKTSSVCLALNSTYDEVRGGAIERVRRNTRIALATRLIAALPPAIKQLAIAS